MAIIHSDIYNRPRDYIFKKGIELVEQQSEALNFNHPGQNHRLAWDIPLDYFYSEAAAMWPTSVVTHLSLASNTAKKLVWNITSDP